MKKNIFLYVLLCACFFLSCSSEQNESEIPKVQQVEETTGQNIESHPMVQKPEVLSLTDTKVEQSMELSSLASSTESYTLHNVPIATSAKDIIPVSTPAVDKIHFLYWGAWEATLLPVQEYDRKNMGGLPLLATFIESKRTPNTIILSTGNLFSGEDKDKDTRPMEESFNLLHLDALTLENLELNRGIKALKKQFKDKPYTLLSANIYQGEECVFTPYIIKKIGNFQVGIIGLTSGEVFIQASPNLIEGLSFRDPIQTFQSCYDKIKSQVDFVVVLSNMRYAQDIELAKAHPNINLIIGRYEIYPEQAFQTINNVLIARIYRKLGTQIGEIEVVKKNGEWTIQTKKLHEISGDALSLKPSTEAEKIIQNWQKQESHLEEVLCTTDIYLEGTYQKIRQEETNLGNLFTDIVLARCPDSDVAFLNSGTIRSSFALGKITRRMLKTALPYDNKLLELSISGEVLHEVLENSVAQYEKVSGSFLQVAGLSFTFDPTQPQFSRVSDVFIHGEPLDLKKQYQVVTCQYLADGGDDYIMLKNKPRVALLEESLSDLVETYFIQQKKIRPSLENRIIKKN
ncbi:MAG TPA: bifunctional UDP-sugar hydrolase/5'-nucleotidase [Planctomycetota bacterium]|nr:bifunctional UDP-sugar hydrolase/5'-nucleotidase [Planctomycetota bacterium]HQB01417.1 bifunctional UDP-sugar hydrolase/5'-nucleotidase [Planctomycetota bacterium]